MKNNNHEESFQRKEEIMVEIAQLMGNYDNLCASPHNQSTPSDEITANNLKELYYSKNLVEGILDEKSMPKLEKIGIGEERIEKILSNPNDYSLEDILKLGKKELKEVSEELKEKLFELAQQKNDEIRKQKEKEFVDEIRKKFNIDEEGKSNQKGEKEEVPPLEKDSDSPSEEET
ncbi:3454_t:CDS:2 [Entrophospora sp. SA101]|nr:3454_t:CDS:2 [Entrophospora sp. SA101]